MKKKVNFIGVFFSALIIFIVLLHLYSSHGRGPPITGPQDIEFLAPGMTCREALSTLPVRRNARYEDLPLDGRLSPGSCDVPLFGYKSWKKGVVTTVSPRIKKDCSKLFVGQKYSLSKVKSQLEHWKNSVSDAEVLENTRNCSWVRDYFTGNFYTTRLERSFPLAFTFVVHDSPQQILRLLRFLYRQHNVYCIHPDKESDEIFTSIFRNIATCLDNVIIPEELIRAAWGGASVLEASVSCLKELVMFRKSQPEDKKWKYVLNLCGKELPLSTNHDIVKHLSTLHGSSNIYAHEVPPQNEERVKRLRDNSIPCNLTYYKSWAYNALSFKFADFALTNPAAIAVYNFFRKTLVPDEHYYATLFRIPGVPGGFDPTLSKRYIEISHYFMQDKRKFCGGERVNNNICVVSVSELRDILRASRDGRWHFFQNKYFMKLDHVVMDCMEERLVARNIIEFKKDCDR